MKHATSRNLYAYWNRRRDGRAAPDRHDIEPYDLGAELVDTFLIRIDDDGTARFRFCGSSIAMHYGRDLGDEDFLKNWNPEDRATLKSHIEMMTANAAGFVAGMVAETASGGFTTFELILLPLMNEGRCDRAIGCLGRVGGHAVTNRIKARIVSQSLRSVRLLNTHEAPGISAAARKLPPPPLPDQTSVRGKFGHLVLVQGGK